MTFKPGAFNHAHQRTTRIPRTDASAVEARNDKARLNLAAFALEQPDPAEWLADMLSALGLDDKTDCPPSPVQLIAPDTAKTPGPRPKWATKYEDGPAVENTEPAPTRGRRKHGTPTGARRGCDCEPCRIAYNAYHADYMRRRRAAQRVERDLNTDTAREGS